MTSSQQSRNRTSLLPKVGQSIWVDNITRAMLENGTLKRYINELSVTGLTSNPTIFDQAIRSSDDYDQAIVDLYRDGKSIDDLFYEVALQDIQAAGALFEGIYERTAGVDGWVSLEISPKLAYDAQSSFAQAKHLHQLAKRKNLLIKIPGTPESLPAIEEAIFAGIPVNVTLLFSTAQYLATAEAYLRGIERRIEAGLDPVVGSVASVFVSRWDKAVQGKCPADLQNCLGLAVAKSTYAAYEDLLRSPRWLRLANCGARAQRLLWASTGTKDPSAPDTLYVNKLATPFTVNTIPEATLLAFADHGTAEECGPKDRQEAHEIVQRFEKSGIDLQALAQQLQEEGAHAFVGSWESLQKVLQSKLDAKMHR